MKKKNKRMAPSRRREWSGEIYVIEEDVNFKENQQKRSTRSEKER